MKLYIKQKVFSITDKFTVKDEAETDKYFVEGEFFTLGKKLHIKDANGTEQVFIQQKLLSFLPKYFIFMEDQQVAEIVQKLSFFKPKYIITGLDWTVEGDFSAHQYQIRNKDGNLVVSLTKAWFSWGDSYELNITNPEDEKMALAAVITIDMAMQQAQSRNNNHN